MILNLKFVYKKEQVNYNKRKKDLNVYFETIRLFCIYFLVFKPVNFFREHPVTW